MKIQDASLELKSQYTDKPSMEPLHSRAKREQERKKKLIKPTAVFKNYKQGPADKKLKFRAPTPKVNKNAINDEITDVLSHDFKFI
jgi:hypothetical protein